MNLFRHNSVCWLLLATFGVIAGGGRGLHFAPIFGLHSHEHSHAACGAKYKADKATQSSKHHHCHHHSHGGHSHHVAQSHTTARQNGGIAEKPSLRDADDDHSDCLICQFFFQGCAETAGPVPLLQQPLPVCSATTSNEVASSQTVAPYLARGPPHC